MEGEGKQFTVTINEMSKYANYQEMELGIR